jgi:transposase
MKQWERIRYRVLREGISKRQILRETGMHWQTLEKILIHSAPPGYRRTKTRPKPKIGPYLERIKQILDADREVPKKQRHKAVRIFERLREEGYSGGLTQVKEAVRRIKRTASLTWVKEAVRRIKRTSQEVFMPLTHRPGEAQVDFGHALIAENGVLRKVVFFVMSLPYSGTMVVQVFERICTEVFWEAHVRAFAWLGGVPWRITYDNEPIFVAQVLGAHERQLTDGFLKFKSHYLFDAHFCRVRCGNEKGVVESAVKYARSHFLVPVPQVRSLEELNEQLWEAIERDLQRRLRGQKAIKAILLERERQHFLELPTAPFDACAKVSTTASSLSLARFNCNDYSVPVRWAHHPVVVKGYTDRVEIFRVDQRIAQHLRLWGKEDVQFDPLHYLALLERKPGALDHARPLEGWRLPECFEILRRRLESEAEHPGQGTREYIRVLRLLEKYPLAELTRAVEKGLRMGALTRDAIAQFLIPQEDWRQTTFNLAGRKHLRQVKVAQTKVAAYRGLLRSGGVP